jgi:hypothetical protein
LQAGREEIADAEVSFIPVRSRYDTRNLQAIIRGGRGGKVRISRKDEPQRIRPVDRLGFFIIGPVD